MLSEQDYSLSKSFVKKRTIDEEGHNMILFFFMPFTMRLTLVLLLSSNISSLPINELREKKQKIAGGIGLLFCFALLQS